MGKQYSIDQQEEVIKKVEKLTNDGYTLLNALKELGISQSAYHSWKRKAKARNSQLREEVEEKREVNNFYVDSHHRLLAENSLLKQRISKLEAMLGKILIERELNSTETENEEANRFDRGIDGHLFDVLRWVF